MRNGFGRHADDVWGIFLLVAGVVVGLSFFGLAGPVGSGITSALELLFGVWRYAVAGALALIGLSLVLSRPRTDRGKVGAGFAITFLSSLALFHLMTGAISVAGVA